MGHYSYSSGVKPSCRISSLVESLKSDNSDLLQYGQILDGSNDAPKIDCAKSLGFGYTVPTSEQIRITFLHSRQVEKHNSPFS